MAEHRSAPERAPETTPLVAFFRSGDEVLAATQRVVRAGLPVREVYGPYPLHEIDGLLERRRSRLPWVTLVAGAFGGLSALAFQFYTAVWDWPINVGGKPANSTLAFIPITFELTVLLGGLATAAALLVVGRLMPRVRPPEYLPRVTDDRFALVVDRPAAEAEATDLRRLLEQAGAEGFQHGFGEPEPPPNAGEER